MALVAEEGPIAYFEVRHELDDSDGKSHERVLHENYLEQTLERVLTVWVFKRTEKNPSIYSEISNSTWEEMQISGKICSLQGG